MATEVDFRKSTKVQDSANLGKRKDNPLAIGSHPKGLT